MKTEAQQVGNTPTDALQNEILPMVTPFKIDHTLSK
jgi:hypothetical protein